MLTCDGKIQNRLSHLKFYHQKTYLVQLEKVTTMKMRSSLWPNRLDLKSTTATVPLSVYSLKQNFRLFGRIIPLFVCVKQ